MAKEATKIKKVKKDGQLKQIWQVAKMTVNYDKKNWIYLLASGLLPLIAGILFPILTSGDWLAYLLWILTGLVSGILLLMIVLGRRAENAAYRQLEGQEGAVGAVLRSALRGKWRSSEMPISVNPRSRDAVYRAVGKPGVILVVEGKQNRVSKIISDEQKKIRRAIGDEIPVEVIEVGTETGQIRLFKLAKAMNNFPKKLNKTEISAVFNRLSSLTANSPVAIPKGIDPFKVRPGRPR